MEHYTPPVTEESRALAALSCGVWLIDGWADSKPLWNRNRAIPRAIKRNLPTDIGTQAASAAAQLYGRTCALWNDEPEASRHRWLADLAEWAWPADFELWDDGLLRYEVATCIEDRELTFHWAAHRASVIYLGAILSDEDLFWQALSLVGPGLADNVLNAAARQMSMWTFVAPLWMNALAAEPESVSALLQRRIAED